MTGVPMVLAEKVSKNFGTNKVLRGISLEVGRGQVLCIVEVMKLMNNIEAKTAGTVTEILVDNEDAVEHGQTLMVIEPK